MYVNSEKLPFLSVSLTIYVLSPEFFLMVYSFTDRLFVSPLIDKTQFDSCQVSVISLFVFVLFEITVDVESVATNVGGVVSILKVYVELLPSASFKIIV